MTCNNKQMMGSAITDDDVNRSTDNSDSLCVIYFNYL